MNDHIGRIVYSLFENNDFTTTILLLMKGTCEREAWKKEIKYIMGHIDIDDWYCASGSGLHKVKLLSLTISDMQW